jgi:hypothetical protein
MATYSLDGSDPPTVGYRATIDGPTYVNLSSHGDGNFAGPGTGAMGHVARTVFDLHRPTRSATAAARAKNRPSSHTATIISESSAWR